MFRLFLSIISPSYFHVRDTPEKAHSDPTFMASNVKDVDI